MDDGIGYLEPGRVINTRHSRTGNVYLVGTLFLGQAYKIDEADYFILINTHGYYWRIAAITASRGKLIRTGHSAYTAAPLGTGHGNHLLSKYLI
jgi:hypothetical protein